MIILIKNISGFILLFLTLLISCKQVDIGKYDFIKRAINSPDSLKSIINNSIYKPDTLPKDHEILSMIKYLKECKQSNEYEFYDDEVQTDKYALSNTRPHIYVDSNPFHLIVIKYNIKMKTRIRKEYLSFMFENKNEKWFFVSIEPYNVIDNRPLGPPIEFDEDNYHRLDEPLMENKK